MTNSKYNDLQREVWDLIGRFGPSNIGIKQARATVIEAQKVIINPKRFKVIDLKAEGDAQKVLLNPERFKVVDTLKDAKRKQPNK